MSALNHSDSLDESLKAVLKIINKLAKKSVGGNYIYRGERNRYHKRYDKKGNHCGESGKISSSLYRQYRKISPDKKLDMEFFQNKNLEESQRYTDQTNEREILSQIQHFGGNTNLIDFTTDYLIALFFACDGAMEKDGRVILLQNSEDASKRIWRPRTPENRIIAQKSIFVQPRRGYLEQQGAFHEIKVPCSLKKHILEYLRKFHGIYRETIYNDLHGFIKNQELHKIAYEKFIRGLNYHNQGNLEKAIEFYDEAIELKPDYAEVYYNRGIAYCKLCISYSYIHSNFGSSIYRDLKIPAHLEGKINRAIQDCTKAIELKPDHAEAYFYLGVVHFRNGDQNCALEDLKKAEALAEKQGLSYLLGRIQKLREEFRN